MSDCRIIGSAEDGIVLRKVSGRISDCEIGDIRKGGLFSEDAAGLEIAHNHVRDCGDNGILVWRSEIGEDGTIVTANRIERIAAKSGGSGQNGNGVNVFRAGSVMVSNNRIADCAFSAIRSNSGSNCQMIGNSCARLGEVALYAEFAFEGAVIANNIVETAAMGISVTNFNEGGRLAVVQGNLIRNIFFRKDADSRGVGIAVEADSVVSGNVIEGAPGYGIMIGWGSYLRDVSVTGNLIRNAHIGIGVSTDSSAGTALITDNLITGAKDGAIRAMNGCDADRARPRHGERRGLSQPRRLLQRRSLTRRALSFDELVRRALERLARCHAADNDAPPVQHLAVKLTGKVMLRLRQQRRDHLAHGKSAPRFAPSSILSAMPSPSSGSAAQCTPSAPPLVKQDGASALSTIVSKRPSPAT